MKRGDLPASGLALGAAALALCCAAPILVSAVAATGLGIWPIGGGVLAAVAASLGASVLIGATRRSRRRSPHDCEPR